MAIEHRMLQERAGAREILQRRRVDDWDRDDARRLARHFLGDAAEHSRNRLDIVQAYGLVERRS